LLAAGFRRHAKFPKDLRSVSKELRSILSHDQYFFADLLVLSHFPGNIQINAGGLPASAGRPGRRDEHQTKLRLLLFDQKPGAGA
jgi:hypothetical protein